MARFRHSNPRDEQRPSPEAEEALQLVEAIEDSCAEVPEHALRKGADFFESVLEKAKSIGATIERTGRVSAAQRGALENMLEGVRKWMHE